MSKKPHSGLKRALAWMLTVAMMAQGCIVYADDFTSEPDAAVVEEAAVSEDVDTSADSDLESADEGEDTSTEADVPEISDEDLDTEVVQTISRILMKVQRRLCSLTEAKKMQLFLMVQKQLEMIPQISVLMNQEKVT